MRFSFIGTIEANDETSKVPYYRTIDGKAKGASLSLTCVEAKNNRAFVEMAGFKNDVIKTMDTDNNKIDVAWDDRLDDDVVKKVASYKKHVITLNNQRHEFISELDFINFVSKNIQEIKGKRFQITGQVSKNEYKGKMSDRFRIQSMYEITDPAKKNELKITGDFYFDKSSVDADSFKEEHKLYLNGWTQEWMNKEHPDALVTRQLVLDCNKLDFSNENHIAVLNYKLKQIGCVYDDGKIVTKLKKGKHYKIAVVCKYLNGQETAEFTEKDLSPNQLDAIKLGIATLDDFKPKGAIYGDRVVIYKLVNYDLRGDYTEGAIEADEFDEDKLYTPAENENIDKAFDEDAMNEPEEDSDDLFD